MSPMQIEYPKRFMLKWKRLRGCAERDNLTAEISVFGAPLLTLIVNLFGVKRRVGQTGDWTGEPLVVGEGIVHSNLTL